ncbi:MAG: ATP-binding protein [Thermodesulfobacteriota bacterium]
MDAADLAGKSREELVALVREQQALLATYKDSLGRIYAEFDAKIEELSLIRRVADALKQAGDLWGLAAALVEVVSAELNADFVCLLLTDPEMTLLCPAALMDRDHERPRGLVHPGPAQCIPLAALPLGQAVAQGRALILAELADPPAPWPAEFPKNPASLLALPLVARQEILGAMLLVSLNPRAFGEQHTRALTILCDHAAAALSNARLIDELGEINQRLLASELDAHQAREYLQRLLDTASDLILVADQAGRVTYANQAAAEFGLDRDRLAGAELAGLFAEPERAARLLAQGRRQSEELELIGPEGRAFLTLVSLTPLESGELLVMVRDVTRRRVLERQLMHAEKLASVGILAAGVAHEIGNPLSAVSGYAQLLAKPGVAEDARLEFAGAIAGQAERIHHIIRDLLDYSRPSPWQGQAVEVNQAIEAVLNMFFTSKRLIQGNVDIARDLGRGLPLVRVDRDQLQQVVLNMVMNAAQAMDGGGRLTIKTRAKDGWVRIAVADTGPGIAKEHLPLIFDPFFTTKPPGQGTGLGLSICDRIVSAAGGRIEVKSRPGKGTTFTVLLPGAE